ncbi:hypothetical protein FH972_026359 [Carpinus fangiana]|uniref:P/Homo B domain-containing protein n=1 Tax=Carpinus fangiana TaxID=176857 RepID=A0A5N6L3V8_9ROSI|nr:hypothetical protein FH972_026359 [Carpinus fangiana]
MEALAEQMMWKTRRCKASYRDYSPGSAQQRVCARLQDTVQAGFTRVLISVSSSFRCKSFGRLAATCVTASTEVPLPAISCAGPSLSTYAAPLHHSNNFGPFAASLQIWPTCAMRFLLLTGLLGLCLTTSAQHLRPRNYETHDYYAVHIQPGTNAAEVASHLGLDFEGPLGELRDHYLLRSRQNPSNVVRDAVQLHKKRRRRRDSSYNNPLLDAVLFHQKQVLKAPMVKRTVVPPQIGPRQSTGDEEADPELLSKSKDIATQLDITDPIYNEQWHLFNPVQPGHDLNVTSVWLQGITGKNVTACIVDDGLDMDSNDLKDNYFAEGSYDFNDQVPEPKPRLDDDRHGTRCAGEVSAVRNDVCGVGVAYDSRIAGIRILSKAITDADEALAMIYKYEENDIYSCSWGPPDDGREMGAPGILIKRAMVQAVQEGRQGLGNIYVFAAGNGASADDNCNFDGYTNSIYSITVGAIDRRGHHPYYSEACSAQLVVTYSSGGGDAIHTTDVGSDKCYAAHGGTSAAGPLAVGIFALALEVRPDLTWRDMQHLVVNTAAPVDQESDWQTTTIGKNFSHQYGYGKLDAWSLVEAAKEFKSVKPQAWYSSPWQHIRHAIPEGEDGLSSTFVVSQDNLADANFERVEHITVTMNVEHARRGDLSVELRSPTGIVSHLSTSRSRDEFNGGYDDWTFMSVAHWGESGEGAWTIIVKDTVLNDKNGTFVDWKLNLFGECVDPEQQDLLPIPNEHDDDDHDREDGAASTVSVTPTSTTELAEHPTDHIDRPVNVKSSSTPALATTTTAAFEAPVMVTATPSPSVGEDEEKEPVSTAEPSNDNFLPSPFPHFGVSKTTQIWIYGALALIIVFVACLGCWYFFVMRKRRRNDNYGYEFDVLDNEDDDQPGANGRSGGRRKQKRAGELYDAFAGESDEEVFSEDEEGAYQDHEENFNEKKALHTPDGSSSSDHRPNDPLGGCIYPIMARRIKLVPSAHPSCGAVSGKSLAGPFPSPEPNYPCEMAKGKPHFISKYVQ